MSGEKLTNSEVGVLLTLMAEARPVSNKELKERYNFTLDGAQRRKLNNLKLVRSEKQGRAFVHELDDNGWARCHEELTAPVPTPNREDRSTPRISVLYALLHGIHRYLENNQLALADIFRADPPPTPAAAPPTEPTEPAESTEATESTESRPGGSKAGEKKRARPPAKAPQAAAASTTGIPTTGTPTTDIPAADTLTADALTADEVEARIRAAYRELAAGPGEWVRLSRLRPLLDDIPRGQVDEALRRMNRTLAVTVAPDEDQKALTDADREAAVRIGVQDKHLLRVEDA